MSSFDSLLTVLMKKLHRSNARFGFVILCFPVKSAFDHITNGSLSNYYSLVYLGWLLNAVLSQSYLYDIHAS